MFWLDEELGAQVVLILVLGLVLLVVVVMEVVYQVYLDGVITVVDSKNCLVQMAGGRDPGESGGLNDWLRQVPGPGLEHFFKLTP